MANLPEKVRRYISDNGIVNLIDCFLDGNTDFYLNNFEEYTPDYDEYLLNSLNYNEFTKKCIYRFVTEFQELFPNILTKKEIVNRIANNLNSNIMFDDLDNDGKNDDLPINGYYNPISKKILVDNDLTSSDVDSVLFHEFLHCITINDLTDRDLESDFLTETVVSLMQDIFQRKFYNAKERPNDYITNYIKQLEIIFGDKLYESYVKNSRDISDLFEHYPVQDYSNKIILHNYVLLFNTINKNINNGGDEYLLKYANAIYELNVALYLYSYLRNTDLNTFEKLNKINELLFVQKTPDMDIFEEMINEFGVDNDVLDSFPDLRYIKDGVVVGRLDDLLKDKIDNFRAASRCGFTKIEDYKDNHMFAKNNVFYSYPSSYYKEYVREENYYNVMYKIERDDKLNLDDYDLDEVYREFKTNSASLREELKNGIDYNREKLVSYRRKNSEQHDFMFKAKLQDSEMYIENDNGIKVYTKKDIISLMDNKDKNSEQNKLLASLMVDGIDYVYTANNSKNVIAEKDDNIFIYTYKSLRKTYDLVCYNYVDTQHRNSITLKKKI